MPTGSSVLIAPDRTCICYRSPDPAAIASAVERALVDDALRERVRSTAHALVASEFSLDMMGAAYDRALRDMLDDRASGGEEG